MPADDGPVSIEEQRRVWLQLIEIESKTRLNLPPSATDEERATAQREYLEATRPATEALSLLNARKTGS